MNSQNRLRSLLLIVPLLIACNFSDRLSAAASAFMETTEESTPPYKELEGIECIPDISGVETAQVVRVIDGDSIEVELNGKKVQVRYIGINTPEYYSDERDEAIKASDANKDLVEGKDHLYVQRSIGHRSLRPPAALRPDRSSFCKSGIGAAWVCRSQRISPGYRLPSSIRES